jgi:hypothetical protein
MYYLQGRVEAQRKMMMRLWIRFESILYGHGEVKESWIIVNLELTFTETGKS